MIFHGFWTNLAWELDGFQSHAALNQGAYVSYEIPSKFALTKYVLECASDVGCCMKPAKTIGDTTKTIRFFVCAYLLVLWCGHTVCL